LTELAEKGRELLSTNATAAGTRTDPISSYNLQKKNALLQPALGQTRRLGGCQREPAGRGNDPPTRGQADAWNKRHAIRVWKKGEEAMALRTTNEPGAAGDNEIRGTANLWKTGCHFLQGNGARAVFETASLNKSAW